MPRFNERGDVAERRQDWYDRTRTVYQECITGHCRIVLSDGTPMADRAANVVIGGGFHWAAWEKHPDGVFDSLGRSFPNGVCGAMGPDGAYVLKLDHWSHGPYDVIEPSGARWRLSDEDIYGVQLLGEQRAIWMGMDRFVRSNFPITLPTRLCWGARYANGVFLVQDIDTGTLVLDGRVIRPLGDYYYFDLFWDGMVYHVTYSPNQADTEPVRFTVSPAELAAFPPVGTVITPPAVSVAPLPRKLLIAPYKSHSFRYGDTPLGQHVGNAILVGEHDPGNPGRIHQELARIAPLGLPMVVSCDEGMPIDSAHLSQTVAWYVHASNKDDLEAKVRRALDLPEKPIIAYLDKSTDGDWPITVNWPGRVRPNVMAYRDPGESLVTFDARVTRMLERVSGYGSDIGLTPAFYTRNEKDGVPIVPVAQIIECMPLYERWIHKFPIVDFLPFADRRPTGMVQHPIFRDWAMAFLKANKEGPSMSTVYVGIIDYDRRVSRRDPRGMLIRYDAGSERPIVKVEMTMEYDEPPLTATFPVVRGSDGRYFRGLCFKPVRTGHFYFKITAWDDSGAFGSARSATAVEVTEDPIIPPTTEEPDINEPFLHRLIEAAWAKHNGELSKRGVMLNEIAWNYNAVEGQDTVGLSRKDSGNNTTQPHTGIKIAFDIIQVRPAGWPSPEGNIFSHMYDCFTDSGPTLSDAEPHGNKDRVFVKAVKP